MSILRPLRHLVTALAVLVFSAVCVFGVFGEATAPERRYAATLLACAFAIAGFASARLRFALLASAFAIGAIVLAGRLKFLYLNTPLLAPDLTYLVNAGTVEVISHYPLLLGLALAALALVPLLLMAAWATESPRLLSRSPRIVRALGRLVGSVAAGCILAASLMPRGPFSGVFDKPMWLAINDKSFITNFFTSFHDTDIVKPATTVDAKDRLDWTAKPAKPVIARKPDVVMILEESTFDPRILKLCQRDARCASPMFEPDARTRASGLLTVHTFGGGTWTSEFSALTGLAHTLFGNAGLYAPYNLAPRVRYTLPRAFRESGYRAIALYPMSGDFLNARNAYDFYGFDAFYDGTDYGLGWESHDADLLKVFQRVYADEKRIHPDQPLFVFMLTLHQHGPHMRPLDQLAPPWNAPPFPGAFKPAKLDEWLNLNLANYFERLRESAHMLASLEAFLFDRDAPAVLLHFGDHQPSFDGAINAIDKKVPKEAGPVAHWVTYYMLKTNFKLKPRASYPVLDIAFLGALALDAAGVPKNAYYQANALLLERCKGRYLDCKDTRTVASYHRYVFDRLGILAE